MITLDELVESMARKMEGVMPNQFKHASTILARAALLAITDSGCVVVPVEPKESQLNAMYGAFDEYHFGGIDEEEMIAVYRAAVDVSPFAPETKP